MSVRLSAQPLQRRDGSGLVAKGIVGEAVKAPDLAQQNPEKPRNRSSGIGRKSWTSLILFQLVVSVDSPRPGPLPQRQGRLEPPQVPSPLTPEAQILVQIAGPKGLRSGHGEPNGSVFL